MSNDGLLQATLQKAPTGSSTVVVIPATSLDAFRSRYVQVFDLARELATSARDLWPVLRSAGIKPALTKEKYFTEFYERSQVAQRGVENGRTLIFVPSLSAEAQHLLEQGHIRDRQRNAIGTTFCRLIHKGSELHCVRDVASDLELASFLEAARSV